MDKITIETHAYEAGYAAFTRGEDHTDYPSSYTHEQINEWLSGYDRACEDGSPSTASALWAIAALFGA